MSDSDCDIPDENIAKSKCENEDCDIDHDEDDDADSDDSDAEIINITQNPLYHILGAYLENEKGVNIADILSSIKRSIDRNTQTLRSVEELLIKNNK